MCKRETNDNEQDYLIKRRFVPIAIEINSRGEYKSFNLKLPHGIKKVAGVILTHHAFTHPMHHNRVFIGTSDQAVLAQAWMRDLPKELLGSENLVVGLDLKADEHAYFAAPERLGLYTLQLDGQAGKFSFPVKIDVTDPWSGDQTTYRVWKSKEAGLGSIKILISPDTGR